MRDQLSRLSRLCLPALLLVVALVAWSSGAQAAGAMHHQDGIHGMHMADGATSCAEATAKAIAGDHEESGNHACPGCLCPNAGYAAALPGLTGIAPATFTPALLAAVPTTRLETQAQVGPPAEPPRL